MLHVPHFMEVQELIFAVQPGMTDHLRTTPPKKREFNGTSMHLLDGYISGNTFLNKITKYNQVPLGFNPSVARQHQIKIIFTYLTLLDHVRLHLIGSQGIRVVTSI